MTWAERIDIQKSIKSIVLGNLVARNLARDNLAKDRWHLERDFHNLKINDTSRRLNLGDVTLFLAKEAFADRGIN